MINDRLTILDKLYMARDYAWRGLHPAFDHAIALAVEAEYQADRTSMEAQCGVKPVYPPLVILLAESADKIVADEKALA